MASVRCTSFPLLDIWISYIIFHDASNFRIELIERYEEYTRVDFVSRATVGIFPKVETTWEVATVARYPRDLSDEPIMKETSG